MNQYEEKICTNITKVEAWAPRRGYKTWDKKYLARERRKALPKDIDYWYFECKIGPTESDARTIREAEIKPMIDKLVLDQHKEFYLEIHAKAGVKSNVGKELKGDESED